MFENSVHQPCTLVQARAVSNALYDFLQSIPHPNEHTNLDIWENSTKVTGIRCLRFRMYQPWVNIYNPEITGGLQPAVIAQVVTKAKELCAQLPAGSWQIKNVNKCTQLMMYYKSGTGPGVIPWKRLPILYPLGTKVIAKIHDQLNQETWTWSFKSIAGTVIKIRREKGYNHYEFQAANGDIYSSMHNGSEFISNPLVLA